MILFLFVFVLCLDVCACVRPNSVKGKGLSLSTHSLPELNWKPPPGRLKWAAADLPDIRNDDYDYDYDSAAAIYLMKDRTGNDAAMGFTWNGLRSEMGDERWEMNHPRYQPDLQDGRAPTTIPRNSLFLREKDILYLEVAHNMYIAQTIK